MKKSICLVLILLLLVTVAPAAAAAGNAYMSGPAVVRAGDTITVSFSAGGGILGGSGTLSYDSSVLTLQNCNAAIGGSWKVEFNSQNFLFYDDTLTSPISNAVIFTATFLVDSSVSEGTDISVSVSNITLSDGQKDMPMGAATYSATIAPPLSDNCRLAALTVENAAITPGFSPDVLEYSASVPFEVSALNLSATAEHSGARVHIENPELAVAATTAVRIAVTAENGKATTYVIYVTRPQDPNYVPSGNANLKELSVDGYVLSPAFTSEQRRYYVWLPYETETVSVNATVEDPRAKVSIGELPELVAGQGNDILITVTAENGTEQVYTVTAIRAPGHEDVESFLNREPKPATPTMQETEPTEEPTVSPATESVTQPVTGPTQPTEDTNVDAPILSLPVMIAVFLGCVLLGATVATAATLAANRTKE